jgi:DNA-binding CsgD family transcriptional regulator
LNLLSKREIDVVRGVAHGLSNREIAERLHLSQHTVKNCLFRIFDKLGVSSRVELLFMTISHERHAQSALQHLVSERAYESLRNQATMVACQNAANRGVLLAQVALAQFYALRKSEPGGAIQAHVWYSIAAEQISRGCKELAKKLTLDQLLEAEQMAADKLSEKNNSDTTADGSETAQGLHIEESAPRVSKRRAS